MRRSLLAGASVLALGAGAWLRLQAGRRRSSGHPAAAAALPPPTASTTEITRRFILYFILPLWLAAGVADWLCHRAADIEGTTGPKESLLHLLMLVEASLPVIAGLFLEITSPVLALMIAAFLLHEATALWDVSYAVTLREVTPIEQHVHSFLEMVPLMALAFIAVLHWPQLLALIGRGGEPAELSIRRKERPLPPGFIKADLAANLVFEVLPYLEELWRTLRAERRRAPLAAAPRPA